MQLTQEQRNILDSCAKNIYISAAPGSGKSTMLSHICAKLLETPANKVLLVTFTNKAADSILAKCNKLDTTRIISGTFHGIAYRLMKKAGLKHSICDENKKRLIIKTLFNCRKDKDKFEEIYSRISNLKSEWPVKYDKDVDRYNKELKKYNLIDFDDIINYFITYLSTSNTSQLQSLLLKEGTTHCLVDELQDTSGPQLEMLKCIHRITSCNFIGVADDDQCQPGPTPVLTTKGYKRIDELDPTVDRLVSFASRGSYISGLTNGHTFEVSSRKYTGNIYELRCDNKNAFSTTNHKWLVRWSEEAKKKDVTVVYLMKQGIRYRIGWCQLFNSEGTFHLGTQARLEKADATWILKICYSKKEASIYESIVASRYGIPTVTFEPINNSIYYDREGIDKIFSELGCSLTHKADTLFTDFKLEEQYPIWTKDIAYQKRVGTQRFITQSCNLIPNLMELPIHSGGKNFNWKVITTVTAHGLSGIPMYSLKVIPHETYICNHGIVTHNSIYTWRGARPENVEDFIKIFKCSVLNMGTNFRSDRLIVSHSAKLIQFNKKRIPKTIRASSQEDGKILTYKCGNPFDEVAYVVAKCQQNKGKDIAILYRNRAFKYHLEFELKRAGLKYKVNDFLDITDRSAIRVMISCLKISCGNFDIFDVEQASKALKGLGPSGVKKLKEDADACGSLSTAVSNWMASSTRTRQIAGIKSLQELYRGAANSVLDVLVRRIELLFIKSFDYQKEMREFMIDITNNVLVNEDSIHNLADELGLNGKDEDEGDKDAKIELSTVHGYKGLEKDIVIMPFCHMYLEAKPGKSIEIEDERRLFYVGVTRAKHKLYMSYSESLPRFILEMGLC